MVPSAARGMRKRIDELISRNTFAGVTVSRRPATLSLPHLADHALGSCCGPAEATTTARDVSCSARLARPLQFWFRGGGGPLPSCNNLRPPSPSDRVCVSARVRAVASVWFAEDAAGASSQLEQHPNKLRSRGERVVSGRAVTIEDPQLRPRARGHEARVEPPGREEDPGKDVSDLTYLLVVEPAPQQT